MDSRVSDERSAQLSRRCAIPKMLLVSFPPLAVSITARSSLKIDPSHVVIRAAAAIR
jgi:hypothetical protein